MENEQTAEPTEGATGRKVTIHVSVTVEGTASTAQQVALRLSPIFERISKVAVGTDAPEPTVVET